MNFFAFFEYCTMWTYLFMSGIVEQISFVIDGAKENNITVFAKWISLNSMNHDKIQKWYGYQMLDIGLIRMYILMLDAM